MSDTIREDLPSGRFVLRIDPRLHAALREAADASGLSLNEFCARKLASPGMAVGGPAAEVVERAVTLTDGALVGVTAFGSWARDELTARSDVDVLVILDRDTCLERELYGRWDASPLWWEGHRVEPHFVHLPPRGARISGLWAEAATDGLVIFERDFSVSRRLAEIRRRIVAGELIRRRIHGQPYWVEAA